MGVLMGFAVSGFLSAMLSARIASIWPSSVVHPVKFTAFLFGALAFHGVAIPGIGYFLWEQHRKWSEAFDCPGPQPIRAIKLGILGALVVIPLAYGLQAVSVWAMEKVGIHPSLQDAVELLEQEPAWFVRMTFFVFAVIAAPVIEECIFRGILFSALRDAGFRRLAYTVSALIFGAIHMNAAAFLPLTLFGLVQAHFYQRSGSLLTPILTHAVFNLAPFVTMWLGMAGPN